MILWPIFGWNASPHWFTTELLTETIDLVQEHIGFPSDLKEVSVTWLAADIPATVSAHAIPTHDNTCWSVVCIVALRPGTYGIFLELARALCCVALGIYPDEHYNERVERAWQVASFIAREMYDKT